MPQEIHTRTGYRWISVVIGSLCASILSTAMAEDGTELIEQFDDNGNGVIEKSEVAAQRADLFKDIDMNKKWGHRRHGSRQSPLPDHEIAR